MLIARLRPTLHSHDRRQSGQSLVELALVMPVLVGLVLVLFQFGIIFISLLSIVHETRDVGRWIAVHPDDKVDTQLQQMARDDAATVINKNLLTLTVAPGCTPPATPATGTSQVNGHCPARNATDSITLHMTYDVTGSLFL